MSTVRFENINKFYGDIQVLNNINLDVEDGEFLVLVGPSGCGKSTTLRMVAGLEDPTDGQLFIGDKVVNEIEPSKRDIAMVFQNYALYPHMSVFENMSFGLKIRKLDSAEITKRVKEAADILQIDDLLLRRPKELSGGQRQRVALGRCIVRNPKVFLSDEPLSNLDAKLRAEMRVEIKKLHQILKTTMMYVTHDQTEAMTMGSRIAVINKGVIEQLDTPDRIYRHPVNKFVAGFIGSPQMNFIEGNVSSSDGILHFASGKIDLDLSGHNFNTIPSKVILGIRPENISLKTSENKSSNNIIKAVVDLIEPLGAVSLLHLNSDGIRFSASIKSIENIIEGIEAEFIFDGSSFHFFDAASQKYLD